MLLIHVSDVCYVKVANRHCADSLFGYPMDDTSLSTALQECSSEKECHAVYDYKCKKHGQMKHCHVNPKIEFSASWPSPSSSCVLIKHRGKIFQILVTFVLHLFTNIFILKYILEIVSILECLPTKHRGSYFISMHGPQ